MPDQSPVVKFSSIQDGVSRSFGNVTLTDRGTYYVEKEGRPYLGGSKFRVSERRSALSLVAYSTVANIEDPRQSHRLSGFNGCDLMVCGANKTWLPCRSSTHQFENTRAMHHFFSIPGRRRCDLDGGDENIPRWRRGTEGCRGCNPPRTRGRR